jgi:hypothetical protein
MTETSALNNYKYANAEVVLGGLVVIVLANGLRIRGFKPGRGRQILRIINSVTILPSEGK